MEGGREGGTPITSGELVAHRKGWSLLKIGRVGVGCRDGSVL